MTVTQELEFTQIDAPLVHRAAEVMALAQEKGLTLITAESCTGGLLTAVLSEGPGAAEYLHGGFVVYTEENKQVALGIPAELIRRAGVVSAPVARALAEAALAHSTADVALGITGVAGPASDDEGNLVGLVHFAAARRGYPTIHVERRFGDIGRGPIRYRSVLEAMSLINAAMKLDGSSEAEAANRSHAVA